MVLSAMAAPCVTGQSHKEVFCSHSRESGNPFQASARANEWIHAFAGMTIKEETNVKVDAERYTDRLDIQGRSIAIAE
jgi:hypothetical protein